MNPKVKKALDDLNQHLKEQGDTKGLILMLALTRAMLEGEGDALRK